MRKPDHDSQRNCRVIPFVRPIVNEDAILTSNIAAVIAVTILHREGESPEERLLKIIDASGEAEVLDIADAFEEYETLSAAPKSLLRPDNDNAKMTLL
jgi:hypothetical protein